ncbi:MAG: ArsR family transcriptional regulator [Ramlibacter sp.]|nr:ArsR family transcriptional regulator [Ramlibacter sp.]
MASPVPSSPVAPAAPVPSRAATQRELRRRYKEDPPAAGVYAIRNLSNGRLLVGSSTNPEGALHRARFELQTGGHRDRLLQQDWKQLGAGAFTLEVIDRLKKSEDPAFDARSELAGLLALWRTELGAEHLAGYGDVGAAA